MSLLGAVLVMFCFAEVSLSDPLMEANNNRGSSVDLGLDIATNIRDDLFNARRLDCHSIEAIYQFGDSISDTGNYMHENPYSTFAQSPYGKTYFHKPTGRCSDGRLMIDYIAKYLKLPFLDAYLDKDGNFTHGVNFAVAGATALNVSTLAAKNIISYVTNNSLPVQLGWFKSHLDSIWSDRSERSNKFAKALFIMGEIGGNDYNFAFFQGKAMQDVYQLVPEVIEATSNAVEEIIRLGAVQIAVPGNFPIGCMTCYLVAFKTNDTTMYDEHKCLKYLNKFAKFHNDQLRKAIRKLRKNYPHVTIVYMDYYAALEEILRHATFLGFDRKIVHKTCCGIADDEYNFDFGKTCGNHGVPACENPQKHVNWDGFHLTEHAYHVMAKWLSRRIFNGFFSDF